MFAWQTENRKRKKITEARPPQMDNLAYAKFGSNFFVNPDLVSNTSFLHMRNKAIGVFDSGIGGLTVFKAISEALPQENLIYLGDTARVPYGTRGKEVITNFALELTKFLLQQDVKFLVVACNTISATCLDKVQALSHVPVLGVIIPAVSQIIKTTKTKKVGIIGTRATISSRAYENEIHKKDPEVKVISQACPLFVPIIEEGLANSDIAVLTAKKYLASFKNTGIDVLHLGCTHYPLLYNVIQKEIGEQVEIIDSAKPTVDVLKAELLQRDLLNDGKNPRFSFYVTDAPERVFEIAKLFLGRSIESDLKKVEI